MLRHCELSVGGPTVAAIVGNKIASGLGDRYLAYVLTAFGARVDWRLAMQATVIPHMEWSRSFFSVLVAGRAHEAAHLSESY